MTEPEWKVLEEYVAATARTMGLSEWVITLQRDPADKGNDADVGWTLGRAVGNLRVSDAFVSLEARRQVRVIAHELLHFRFANAWDVVEEDLGKGGGLSAQSFDVLHRAFKRQMEYAIDATATALAQFLPLIPWGSDTDAPPAAPPEEPAP